MEAGFDSSVKLGLLQNDQIEKQLANRNDAESVNENLTEDVAKHTVQQILSLPEVKPTERIEKLKAKVSHMIDVQGEAN